MKPQAGRDALRVLTFFFGTGFVVRNPRGGWLSIAARRMRLMRV